MRRPVLKTEMYAAGVVSAKLFYFLDDDMDVLLHKPAEYTVIKNNENRKKILEFTKLMLASDPSKITTFEEAITFFNEILSSYKSKNVMTYKAVTFLNIDDYLAVKKMKITVL